MAVDSGAKRPARATEGHVEDEARAQIALAERAEGEDGASATKLIENATIAFRGSRTRPADTDVQMPLAA